MAEVIGDQFRPPVVSLSQDEASAHYGPMAMFIGGYGPDSIEQTRERLGWAPREPGPQNFRTDAPLDAAELSRQRVMARL